jgi:hypothetical protein
MKSPKNKQMTNTSELWVQMGNVSSVKDGRRVLPGAHALSGCNTTSSFFGNGKRLGYKILKDAASDFHDLDNLGSAASEGGNITRVASRTVASFTRSFLML